MVIDIKNSSLKNVAHLTAVVDKPAPSTLGMSTRSGNVPLSPETLDIWMDNGVEIEGIPKGGKRRGQRRPRVPRQILRSGSKYDISMGRHGFFRCPHLGVYCSCGSARNIQNCRGGEDCELREANSLVDRLWRNYNASRTIYTAVNGEVNGLW